MEDVMLSKKLILFSCGLIMLLATLGCVPPPPPPPPHDAGVIEEVDGAGDIQSSPMVAAVGETCLRESKLVYI